MENEGVEIPGEVEDRAKRMGWVPKDKFKGDEERWVPADKFLERGETELPIMRERIKKMDGTIANLNKTIKDMRHTFGEFQEFQKNSETRAYNKALKDILEKQKEAVKHQDEDAFEKLEAERAELEKPTQVATPPVEDAEAEEIFNEWKLDNEWFDKDSEMQQYAVHVAKFIEDNKGKDGMDLYNEVTKEVKLRFPEKFENKNRNEPPAVVGAESEVPPPKGKKTFGNLPKEAQEACNKFVKTIPGYTKEEYLKSYEWE